MKFEVSRIIAGIYLISTAVSLGALFMCVLLETYIFDLDSIFRANSYTDTLVTRYDQGIIMSMIWDNLYYILLLSSIVILVYETLSFRFRRSTFFVWILNVLNVILMLLLCFFYLPEVAKIFNGDPVIVATPESNSIINQIELIIQLLCITLFAAFFMRVFLMTSNAK